MELQQQSNSVEPALMGVSHISSSATDLELPPSRRSKPNAVASKHNAAEPTTSENTGNLWRQLSAPLLGCVLLAYWLMPSTPAEEGASPNWTHHQQAVASFESSQDNGLKFLTTDGQESMVNCLELTSADLDQATTHDFQSVRWDARRAEQVLKGAQPELNVDDAQVDAVQPVLSEGLRADFLNRDTQFYHLFLFDSCYQDGDVVDVLINGRRFATVQLTNSGVTLSVPMNSASQISVQGVSDGGGGITVACRTSQGEGFVRVLSEGEEQLLAVVAR
ncbi:MAG: hypothetical protein KDB22_05645 [Planctomycetales bacterium]|nr:hypothetical protein [Planctomycetales bacterium]